jgi:hypothetical protein
VRISRRLLTVISLVVIIAGSAWLWRGCTASDEEQIFRVVDEGRAAIEEKSLRGVMGLLAPDYHDNLGLTIQSVRPMLQRLFLGVEAIRIDFGDPATPVIEGGSPPAARVELSVVVSGAVQGQPIYLLGTPGQRVPLTLALVKQDGDWLVSEVRGLRVPELE